MKVCQDKKGARKYFIKRDESLFRERALENIIYIFLVLQYIGRILVFTWETHASCAHRRMEMVSSAMAWRTVDYWTDCIGAEHPHTLHLNCMDTSRKMMDTTSECESHNLSKLCIWIVWMPLGRWWIPPASTKSESQRCPEYSQLAPNAHKTSQEES
jgi:hypothetical protein